MRILHAIYPALVLCAHVHAQVIVIDFGSLIKGAKDSIASAKSIAENALAGSKPADTKSKTAALWADAQRTVSGVQGWYTRARDVVSAVVPPPATGSKDDKPALIAQFARELKNGLQKTLALGAPSADEQKKRGKKNDKKKTKKKNKHSGRKAEDRWKTKLDPNVALILGGVEDAVVRICSLWNAPEEYVRRDFGTVMQHINEVFEFAGKLVDPSVFKREAVNLFISFVVPLIPISPTLAFVLVPIFRFLLPVLGPIFKPFLPVLGPIFRFLLPVLGPIFKPFLPVPGPIFRFLLPVLGPIFKPFLPVLGPIFRLLLPAFGFGIF